DELSGRRRWRLSGQSLSHHQRHRFLDGRVRPVGDLVEFAAVETVVEHGRGVLGNARHAACAHPLAAGLLDRLEYRARLLSAWHELAVDHRVVTGELECDGVGMAPPDVAPRPPSL